MKLLHLYNLIIINSKQYINKLENKKRHSNIYSKYNIILKSKKQCSELI